MPESRKEVSMKRKVTKANRTIKCGYVIAVSMTCLFTFVMLGALPSLACKGIAHSGYNITMNMADPDTGDLFATITFNEVRKEGMTRMAKSKDIFPSPSHFDIVSAADYSGEVKVCLNYKAIGFSDASGLRVSHFTDNSWMTLKTTVDKEKNTVCGISTSLSHFTIFKDPRSLYGPGFWYHHSFSRR
jgi:hypothetical protein